jgi:hypothetical protein
MLRGREGDMGCQIWIVSNNVTFFGPALPLLMLKGNVSEVLSQLPFGQ